MRSTLTTYELGRIIYLLDTIWDDFSGKTTATHVQLMKNQTPWEIDKKIQALLKSDKRSPMAQLRYLLRNPPKLLKLFKRKYYSVEEMIIVSNLSCELVTGIIKELNTGIERLNHIRNYTYIKLTLSACFEIIKIIKDINVFKTFNESLNLSSSYIKDIEIKLNTTYAKLERCDGLNAQYKDIVSLITDKLTCIRSKQTRRIFYPPVNSDLIAMDEVTQNDQEIPIPGNI